MQHPSHNLTQQRNNTQIKNSIFANTALFMREMKQWWFKTPSLSCQAIKSETNEELCNNLFHLSFFFTTLLSDQPLKILSTFITNRIFVVAIVYCKKIPNKNVVGRENRTHAHAWPTHDTSASRATRHQSYEIHERGNSPLRTMNTTSSRTVKAIEDPVLLLEFIKTIRKHRCLWDYTVKDYRNNDVVAATWKAIAEEFRDTGKKTFLCEDQLTNSCATFSILFTLV